MTLLISNGAPSILKAIAKSFIISMGFLMLPITAFSTELPLQANAIKLEPIKVKINLLSFNAPIGDLDVRLEMVLPKQLIGEHDSPREDIYLVDVTSVQDSTFKLAAEKRFSIFDAVLPTKYEVEDAGTQFLYPFDVHYTKIAFFSEMHVPAQSSLTPVFKKIPVTYDCTLCSFEGFDVKVSKTKDFSQNLVSLDVSISRAKAVVIFSVLIIFGMWVVGAAVTILTYRIVKSNTAPDVAALGFTGGLLFALPAVRSIQPMVPPVGILADYLGFFWVELLIIVSLIVMVICWAQRTDKAS